VAHRPVTKRWLCKQRPLLGNDTWSVPRCYKQGTKLHPDSSVLHGVCEERTWAREDEESPLLEVIARQRLMKTQQDGKRLSVCCGDLWIVEIGGGAVIACSTKSCKWSQNPFINSNPVYSHYYYLTIFFQTIMDSNTEGPALLLITSHARMNVQVVLVDGTLWLNMSTYFQTRNVLVLLYFRYCDNAYQNHET
jgi:hypothetical protein